MELQPNNVSIYAAGGAGLNIVAGLSALNASGAAAATAYGIDTSKSNLRESKFSSDNLFLFEGVDGSGKVRAENHQLIAKTAKQILLKFKPGAFNIVIHSGGGGSGGVIGGALVSELLNEGQQVVAIVIGSTNSQIEVENTEKSLKTYDALARKYDCPVVVHYLENSVTASRKVVDGGAAAAIQALLRLYSGLNTEMDSADLRNWIKHAGASEVFSLQFCPTLDAYAKAGNVVSVATLSQPDQNTALDPAPAYQTVGYVADSEGKEAIAEPLHFVLSGNLIDDVARSLHGKKTDNAKRLRAAVRREALVNDDDNVSDNGVVI